MKFKLISLISVVLLSGCNLSDSTTSYESLQSNLTGDLKDCKAYFVHGFTVIRCPNSSTSTFTNGKTRQTITLTEDDTSPVEIVPVETKPEPKEKVILMDGKKYKITEL